MSEPVALDSAWIAANPLPVHGDGTTKDSRGHVVAVGGSRSVPGALRLTVEAALRVGAGKVQLATIGSAASTLGMLIPEAGVIAFEDGDDGEIGAAGTKDFTDALDRCDVVVVGPGMGSAERATGLLADIVAAAPSLALVIDAVAVAGCAGLRDLLGAHAGALVITPHHGEMAALLGTDIAEVRAAPREAARVAAADYRATVVLKGSETFVVSADGATLHYGGGGVGLATGGSGDVLAGAIAGLISRGADATAAAAWGVWLHGQAARRLAAEPGPVGFLARELPGQFPRLLPQ